jgi:hypothetical protein
MPRVAVAASNAAIDDRHQRADGGGEERLWRRPGRRYGRRHLIGQRLQGPPR